MKLMTNWKTALIVMSVFAFTMVLLPGFTAKAIAADTSTPGDTGAGAAGTGNDDNKKAAAGAGMAGASGGEATFAGLSTGTIVAGAVILAAGIAIIAASSGGSSTSHH
jgi:hypothetical protein